MRDGLTSLPAAVNASTVARASTIGIHASCRLMEHYTGGDPLPSWG